MTGDETPGGAMLWDEKDVMMVEWGRGAPLGTLLVLGSAESSCDPDFWLIVDISDDEEEDVEIDVAARCLDRWVPFADVGC